MNLGYWINSLLLQYCNTVLYYAYCNIIFTSKKSFILMQYNCYIFGKKSFTKGNLYHVVPENCTWQPYQ